MGITFQLVENLLGKSALLGAGYFALCPFCGEKTGSFFIDLDKNYFVCVGGCEKKGNLQSLEVRLQEKFGNSILKRHLEEENEKRQEQTKREIQKNGRDIDLEMKLKNPISLNELMNKEFPKVEWLVEQLVPAGGVIAISGLPSAYKTWLVLDLAIKVAQGEILFGRFMTTQTGVLIIDEETGERWIKERVVKLQNNFDLPVYLLSKRGFKLTKETVNQLISVAEKKEIGLVIFDSLLRIHTARDENDAVEMAKVFRLLQELTNAGLTVIFTHHHRKQGILRRSNPSQDMRGSSDILAAVDCHLAIERKDDVLIIAQTKLRQGEEIKPFKLNIINEEAEVRLEFAGEVDEEQTLRADFKENIKDLLKQQDGKPMYKKEIFETLKKGNVQGGYSTFKSAIQELIEKGQLFEQKGEKNKVFCSLKPFKHEQELFDESRDS